MPQRAEYDPSGFAHAESIGPADLFTQFFGDGSGLGGVVGGLKAGNEFAGPVIKTLGKTVKEALGSIFTTPKGSGLPQRLRFVNYNTRDKLMHLRAEDATRERLDIPLNQFERMLTEGAIGLQPRPEPQAAGTALIQDQLKTLLGQTPKP